MFDLGTGLRNYGTQLIEQGRAEGFQGAMLLSHLHWDHVQGLPFFVPLHIPGNVVDIYGPRQQDGPLGEVFEGMMRPPYFPIRPDQLEGAVLLPRRGRRRLPRARRQGAVAVDPSRRPDARDTASTGTA